MKKILLLCLCLSFLSTKCEYNEYLKCTDCSDKKAVLEAVNEIVEKRTRSEIEKFKIETEEDSNSYTVIYTKIEVINNPLMKGGSTLIRISKTDCRILEHITTK